MWITHNKNDGCTSSIFVKMVSNQTLNLIPHLQMQFHDLLVPHMLDT